MAGRLSGLFLRLDIDDLLRAPVIAHQPAVLPLRVNNIRVGGIDLGLVAIAADGDEPVFVGDPGFSERPAGAPKGVVVLGAAVDVVEGLRGVDAHPVELGDGEILLEEPGRSPVEALVDAAVATHQ